MDDFMEVIVAGCIALVCFVLGTCVGEEKTLEQAYDHGYAIECVGKAGYYWECE